MVEGDVEAGGVFGVVFWGAEGDLCHHGRAHGADLVEQRQEVPLIYPTQNKFEGAKLSVLLSKGGDVAFGQGCLNRVKWVFGRVENHLRHQRPP